MGVYLDMVLKSETVDSFTGRLDKIMQYKLYYKVPQMLSPVYLNQDTQCHPM